MSTPLRRILCAESHRDVAELIARMLEQKGYEVEVVQTASDCLRLASEEAFDLYILNDDYIDADGVELCQQLRAMTPSVPVLLFSLDGSGRDRQHALGAGSEVYRSKTSDFVALLQTIDRLLQS